MKRTGNYVKSKLNYTLLISSGFEELKKTKTSNTVGTILSWVYSRELHAAESEEEEEVKENEKLVRKPSKLTITAEDFAAKQEAARQKKLELERRKRQEKGRHNGFH